MKTNFAPGFTKFISRFRTKVLAITTNCWSLCRTINSLFSCGFSNQYSDVANQFFFVFNHTHQQQQQQQFKFFSVEQTLQSQYSHCSDTVRSLYTSRMNSYKAARPNSDHWDYLLSRFPFETKKRIIHWVDTNIFKLPKQWKKMILKENYCTENELSAPHQLNIHNQ